MIVYILLMDHEDGTRLEAGYKTAVAALDHMKRFPSDGLQDYTRDSPMALEILDEPPAAEGYHVSVRGDGSLESPIYAVDREDWIYGGESLVIRVDAHGRLYLYGRIAAGSPTEAASRAQEMIHGYKDSDAWVYRGYGKVSGGLGEYHERVFTGPYTVCRLWTQKDRRVDGARRNDG